MLNDRQEPEEEEEIRRKDDEIMRRPLDEGGEGNKEGKGEVREGLTINRRGGQICIRPPRPETKDFHLLYGHIPDAESTRWPVMPVVLPLYDHSLNRVSLFHR